MARLTPPDEKEFIAQLRRGSIQFPPLKLVWEKPTQDEIDAIVRMEWQKKTFRFAVEYKPVANPKMLAFAAQQAEKQAMRAKLLPLVIASYLNEQALDTLEAEGVSGIDLCGNGVVSVPGKWYIRRAGSPSAFGAEGAIKNVYRKASSVVARLFLVRPEFASLQDALEELLRRGGRVTLPTVSKVCKRLEEDLIIERQRAGKTKLRLIQPEKLLDQLAANYVPPAVTKRVTGKLSGVERGELRQKLGQWAERSGEQVALTGASSVGSYAVMARNDSEAYYCTEVDEAVRSLGDRFQPTERFATITLLETRDEEVYFDRREDLTASPVETFLELSGGDKRDRETAMQVRKVILSPN